jgi:hypothetical protein
VTTPQPPQHGQQPYPPQPPYGQQPPPGYGYPPPQQAAPEPPKKKRRKWPFVLAILAVLIVVIAVNSSGGDSPSSPSSAAPAGTVPAAFPGATANDVAGNAGDTLTVGDMQVTASALKSGDSTLGKTLCSTVKIVNTGSTAGSFNIIDWKLQDPNGAALLTGFTGSSNMLSSGELAPGGSTSGDMCFDAKSAAKGQYVLLYDPMDFSSDRGAWLNQV